MKFLVIIPARKGSKGLLGKNVKILNGKPLIAYTIEAAKQIAHADDICISSDDSQVISIAKNYGVNPPFIRPDELSTDFSSTNEVIIHAVNFYKQQNKIYDFVIFLQPTSPLRTGIHIKEALSLITPTTEMLLSVHKSAANPYYTLFEENEEGTLIQSKPNVFLRRQDAPTIFQANGAIYIINLKLMELNGISGLKKTKYVMDYRYSIDIDTLDDFLLAEFFINQSLNL
jgi:N-acylneuraminate cytidylyltransferase